MVEVGEVEDLEVDPLDAEVGPLAEAVPDLLGAAPELVVAELLRGRGRWPRPGG